MKKKIGLEHTIRNIMTESVGAIGTDKFSRTANSFFKSFHAEPKVGDTHPNGNTVRATRNAQKEAGSKTMNTVTEEEQVNELFKGKESPLDPVLDYLFKKSPKNLAPPSEAPTVPKPKIEPKEAPVEVPVEKPKEAPAETPVEKPKEAPKTVEEPAAKPDLKLKPDDATKPKPGEETPPKPKPESSTRPKVDEKPKSKAGGTLPIPFPPAIHPLSGIFGGTYVKTVMHSPEGRLGESTESYPLEIVARPWSKIGFKRQAEIKTKIIDETSRKANIVRKAMDDKKATVIDLKPKLKGLEIDEKYVGSAGAAPQPKRTPPTGAGVPKSDSALSRVKNYLTDPGTYKRAGISAFQMAGGMMAGIPAGVYTGPALTKKIDKSTGETIDKSIESSGLSSVMPTGKRNPETGAFEPDDPKYKYGGLSYGDVYKNVRAGIDTGVKNVGSMVGLSKGTTFEKEREQEEQKYPKPKEFSWKNPMTYDVDTTADLLQMVPNKYAQAAGLGVTVARNVARRDPTNLAFDVAQYGPYGKIAKKMGFNKFSNAADTIVPSAIGGYQIGTDWAKRQEQK